MVLLTREPDSQVMATIAPPLPQRPMPPELGQQDWSLSLGICALVGIKVWELIKKSQADDSDLNRELVRGLLDERKILLQALLERQPG